MSSNTAEGKKKMQNGVKRAAFSILAILMELLFILAMFTRLNEYAVGIEAVTHILSIILVLKIYGTNV